MPSYLPTRNQKFSPSYHHRIRTVTSRPNLATASALAPVSAIATSILVNCVSRAEADDCSSINKYAGDTLVSIKHSVHIHWCKYWLRHTTANGRPLPAATATTVANLDKSMTNLEPPDCSSTYRLVGDTITVKKYSGVQLLAEICLIQVGCEFCVENIPVPT